MDYKVLMQQAISLAKEAAVKGDVPVGALVVDDAGNVVGQGANLREQKMIQPHMLRLLLLEVLQRN